MEVLALIPARGGSKGIPRKNLVPFLGKPLVAHSIDHALACSAVTRTLVSTDDEEIAGVAQASGAEVPFMRPRELGLDHVLDLPVFEHALRWLEEKEGYRPDLVVHLRPTTPHRNPAWIAEAVRRLTADEEADSIRSVHIPPAHPYRMFDINARGYLEPIMKHRHPTPFLLRRQDLPPVYFYNCVIDVTRPRTIFGQQSMTGANILPYIMSADEVIDIDSPRDLVVARALFGEPR